MGRKNEGVNIPTLDKEQYYQWKVKMRMHLFSIDTSYKNCIEKGPHILVKINTSVKLDGNESEDEEVPKNISEFTEEDERRCTRTRKP